MGYVLVLVLAVGVGAAVYQISMRWGPGAPPDVEEWRGTEPASGALTSGSGSTLPGPPDGGSYIPVSPGRPSWQSRLGGVMGLVLAVTVAAVVLALTLYELGSFISRLLSSAANSG